jgi:hypothetical protein
MWMWMRMRMRMEWCFRQLVLGEGLSVRCLWHKGEGWVAGWGRTVEVGDEVLDSYTANPIRVQMR